MTILAGILISLYLGLTLFGLYASMKKASRQEQLKAVGDSLLCSRREAREILAVLHSCNSTEDMAKVLHVFRERKIAELAVELDRRRRAA